MFIIKYKKVFVSIAAILMALSIFSIAYFGLNLGIDFKGGSLLEVTYSDKLPDQESVKESVRQAGLGEALVQPLGTDGYSIKIRTLSEEEHQNLVESLPGSTEKSFTSIGPSVGAELARKALLSFIFVSLGIIFFIAFSFRKISKPVSSWKYGFIAIVSLIHDILIPVGLFAFISSTMGTEVDTLFVVAILTILGLSVSDTIVVFDRIRENINKHASESFESVVGKSLNQVFTRSISTSVTTILVLLALVFFGPEPTRVFAIMLTAGMFFGTYSSLFLASPLLVLISGTSKK